MEAAPPIDPEPVHLFWTGGWDSTFRLLQLLLVHRLPVVPVYLIDDTRASTDIEFKTMDRIRATLFEGYPHTRALLLPHAIFRVDDVQPDAAIERDFATLVRRYGMGCQYGWLARFVRQQGLQGIEMSCECGLHGAGVMLQENIAPTTDSHGLASFHIPPDAPDQEAARVFGMFGLPIVRITRQDMIDDVRRHDWGALMGLTWFCHRPTRDAHPCGFCNPCLMTIKQGFGWRVSRPRRALGAVYRVTLLPMRKAARNVMLKVRAAKATRTRPVRHAPLSGPRT